MPINFHSKPLLAALLALLLSACATTPGGPHIDRSYSSENQDSRAQFLVLHYTAIDWEKSLRALTKGGQVSSHYLVRDEPVRSYLLVDESRRAWHAGQSFWAGHTNLNASSIGIEIVNTGFVDTPSGRVYAPYPEAQITEVIALVKDIVARHQIRPERIIGHADIAPGRKQDPGPKFPWKRLADEGLIPWPDMEQVKNKIALFESLPPDAAWFQDKLSRIGYKLPLTGQMDAASKDVLSTFQMKYRPSDYSGKADAETAALLEVMLSPNGMLLVSPIVADGAAGAAPGMAPAGEAKPYTSRW
ncbi:N-acetylmuramoyl-L-alanine amidase [Paucibacter sp. B2R-40]|uniref:N-acetylmuramoyl-L-alanine amidase n=1 Tax=Paucibacter sp. B2R-40 TaxID=2893554 RepID=UPI0021E490EF|nr:N-acetylmuramoyl-L-alanine amidase [Paucibacter sp. B2R-40]MCV2356625.1 N-acetylmuramoyl-L-alanine amidase [Paucibacter sp. B2R-40]